MADKDFDDDEVRPDDEGSGAQAPDPESQDAADVSSTAPGGSSEGDELTVDDILGTEQTADAAAEDAVADAADDLFLDLKRLQAEYANYRRRTEEQREIEAERAKGAAIKALLPVLDDLDRAEKHGDLDEGSPFAAIADKIRSIVERMGVVTYGAAGEEFDPQQHEAIFQAPTPGVTIPTILEVVETGYRLGSTELRPAKVVVAVPAE
jgi:molecular chaperone GrpE